LRVVIIDDEQKSIDYLQYLLNNFNEVKIVGKYTNPEKLIKELPKLHIDVAFVDMKMGKLHGLEVAESVSSIYPHIEIIFVTAYPEFALEAYEVNALDYLLKPVDIKRLEKTIDKLNFRISNYIRNKQKKEKNDTYLIAQIMGEFLLYDSEMTEVKWRTKKVKELFAFLWHHNEHGVNRSQILMALWPDLLEEKAIAMLHTTVYELRKEIHSYGFEAPVIFRNERYVLNVTVKSDLDKLKNILSTTEVTQSKVSDLIKFYIGDYLENESYEWAFHEQEKIKSNYLRYLERYVFKEYDKNKRSYLVKEILRKMIQLEPYKKEYIILLVEYYGETNNYKEMSELLLKVSNSWEDDLGLKLPREIVELYSKYINYR